MVTVPHRAPRAFLVLTLASAALAACGGGAGSASDISASGNALLGRGQSSAASPITASAVTTPGVSVSNVASPPPLAVAQTSSDGYIGSLNDTGFTVGGNAPAGNNAGCIGETVSAQDCATGRDADAALGRLAKVGFGRAGFDWTKLGPDGQTLPNDAPVWSCIRDNVTGLIWENKLTDGSIRDGRRSFTNLGNNAADDASSLVAAVNAAGLCGAKDWRLPTVEELTSVQDYSVPRPGPMIDTSAFPNNGPNWYWTATPVAGAPERAWDVCLFEGYINLGYNRNLLHADGTRSDGGLVMLVRGG